MKELKYLTILLLFATMFTTPSLGQGGYKTVPDSLTCITPSQVNRHISDAFILSDLRASNISLSEQVENWKLIDRHRQNQIIEAHRQESLQFDNYNNCRSDLESEKDKLKLANRKIKILKTGLYLSLGVAIIELGYIGLKSLTR